MAHRALVTTDVAVYRSRRRTNGAPLGGGDAQVNFCGLARGRSAAPAGEITFVYSGQGNVHTLAVEGLEDQLRLEVDGIGDRDEGSLNLLPGSYVIYCDIPGHREIGMEATLVVG